MTRQYCIAIQGQKAVNAGYAFQRGSCYRGIFDHGKKIAQLEVVLDEDTYYNGILSKWVDVIVFQQKDIEKTLGQLEKIGFKGCPCIISLEKVQGCFSEAKSLCCLII